MFVICIIKQNKKIEDIYVEMCCLQLSVFVDITSCYSYRIKYCVRKDNKLNKNNSLQTRTIWQKNVLNLILIHNNVRKLLEVNLTKIFCSVCKTYSYISLFLEILYCPKLCCNYFRTVKHGTLVWYILTQFQINQCYVSFQLLLKYFIYVLNAKFKVM